MYPNFQKKFRFTALRNRIIYAQEQLTDKSLTANTTILFYCDLPLLSHMKTTADLHVSLTSMF